MGAHDREKTGRKKAAYARRSGHDREHHYDYHDKRYHYDPKPHHDKKGHHDRKVHRTKKVHREKRVHHDRKVHHDKGHEHHGHKTRDHGKKAGHERRVHHTKRATHVDRDFNASDVDASLFRKQADHSKHRHYHTVREYESSVESDESEHQSPQYLIHRLLDHPRVIRTKLLRLGKQVYLYPDGEKARDRHAAEVYESIGFEHITKPFADDHDNRVIYNCMQWLFFVARTLRFKTPWAKEVREKSKKLKVVKNALPPLERYYTCREIARGWCLRAEELHELSLELDEMYQDKKKRKKLRNPHGEHITHSDYDKMRTRLRRWQIDCLYDAMSHLKTGKRAMTAYEEDMHRHPHRYRERNTFRRPKTQILRDEQKVRNGLFLVYARQYARWSRPEMEEKGKGKADIYLDRAFHQIRIYEGLQGWASRNIHPLKMSSEMEEFRNEHEDEVFATRAKSEARSRDSSRSRVLKRRTARERRHSN